MISKKLRIAFFSIFLITVQLVSGRDILDVSQSSSLLGSSEKSDSPEGVSEESSIYNDSRHENGEHDDSTTDESSLYTFDKPLSPVSSESVSPDDPTLKDKSEAESSIIEDIGETGSSKLDIKDSQDASSETSSLLDESKVPQSESTQSDSETSQSGILSYSSSIEGSESDKTPAETSEKLVSSYSPKSHEESIMLLDDPNYTVDDALALLQKQRKIQDAASGKSYTQTTYSTPEDADSKQYFGEPLLSRLTKDASYMSESSTSRRTIPEPSVKDPSVYEKSDETDIVKDEEDPDLDSYLDLNVSESARENHNDNINVLPLFEGEKQLNEVSAVDSLNKKSTEIEKSTQDTDKTSVSEETSAEFDVSSLTQPEDSVQSISVDDSKESEASESESDSSEENEEISSPLVEELHVESSDHETEDTSSSNEPKNDQLPFEEVVSKPDSSLQIKTLEGSKKGDQSLDSTDIASSNVEIDNFALPEDLTQAEKSAGNTQQDEFPLETILPTLDVQTYDENERKANKLRGVLLPVSDLFQTALGCAPPCPYARYLIQTDRVLKSISKFEAKALELNNIIKKARMLTIKEVSDTFKFHETAIKRRALLFVQKYAKGIKILLFKIDSAKKVVLLALKARILLQLLPTKTINDYSQQELQKFYSNTEFAEKEYNNLRELLNSKTIKYALMKYLSLSDYEYNIKPIRVVVESELTSFLGKMPTFQKFVSRHRSLAFALYDLMKKANYPVKKRFFMIDRKGLSKEQRRLYKKKLKEDKKTIKSKLSKKEYKKFKQSQDEKWKNFSRLVYK